MKILDGLRYLDAYPKTLEEYRQKTVAGAAGLEIHYIFKCLL